MSWEVQPGGSIDPDSEVDVFVRPENLRIEPEGSPNTISGTVTDRRFAGETTFYKVRLRQGENLEVAAGANSAAEGDRVGIGLRDDRPAPRTFPRSPEGDS